MTPRRFIAFMLASAFLAAAAPSRGEDGGQLLTEEDRIDLLDPARQADEYVRLRGRLMESGVDSAQASLARVALKLEFAGLRARHPTPGHATRLAMSELAARIGESHLRQDDPDRAHRYETLARAIEPGGGHASFLRNAIDGWFADRLGASLARAEWHEAREVLSRWRRLLGNAPAMDAATVRYARARARRLLEELGARGAAAVLREARWEEERYAAPDVWEEMTREAARSLQRPFDDAIAERGIEEARVALERQRAVAEEFALAEEVAPLASNEDRLKRLADDLRPPPLELPFGHVLYPVFRLEFGSRAGRGGCSGRDEEIGEPGTAGEVSLAYRRAGEGRRFMGADFSLGVASASDGPASCDASFAALNFLYGARGRNWAAWAGAGFVHATVDFLGQAVSDEGSGYALGNVRLGAERALGDSFAFFLDADYVSTDAVSRRRARLGLRYFANRNFAVGVFLTSDDFRVRDSSSGADTRGDFLGGGFSAAIQF